MGTGCTTGIDVEGGIALYLENSIVAANQVGGTNVTNYNGNCFDVTRYSAALTDNGGNIFGKVNTAYGGLSFASTSWYDLYGNSTGDSVFTKYGTATTGSLYLDTALANNSTLNGTQTLAITNAASVVVDNGLSSSNGSVSVPNNDQRGLSRSGAVDIGAYEYGGTASYTLTVTKAGTGSGTVTATGISCGADCTETYTSGTSVTLTGSADSGSSFAGWSSGTGSASSCSGTGDCTFSITATSGVTATFTLNNYTVTYNGNTNTGGSVPTDGNTYHITDTVTVLGNTGSLVKTGYTFAGWNTAANGSGTGYSGGNTFAMGSANVTLYAQWTVNTYTVTTTATNGTITSTNNPTVNYGDTTTVTGTANPGYYFTGVSGCGGTAQSNTDQSVTTFSYTTGAITGNCSVAANFTLACGCIFAGTITPERATYPAAGGNGTVQVTEPGCCCWTAQSNASWITVTKGANGCGYENVTYTVTENPGLARTGTITIAWQTFTISQSSGCSFTISPQSASYSASGGTGSVNVTASDSACTWTATSNADWITITSGSSGTGNGTVEYSVAENTGSARKGTITIAGSTFTVSQAPACIYTLNSASVSYPASGGNGSITVTASDSACSWTAASNADWITITSGSGGTGSGTVEYSVAENTGSARTGTITIAGNTFTVNQSSVCTYSINPTSASYAASGGSGSATITASDSACTWTAASNADWITITSGSSGTGSGTVSYTVEENPELSARTGEITTADQTHSVIQEGRGITFDDVIGMYDDYVQGLCTWDDVIAVYFAYVMAQVEEE